MNSSTKKSELKLPTWNTTLEEFFGKNQKKTLDKLAQAGIATLNDLIWIFPNRIIELPKLSSFEHIHVDEFFLGRAQVISVQGRPNFWAKGKRKAMLYNVNVNVKDVLSDRYLTLKWFNCYSSVYQKLNQIKFIEFFGVATLYNGQFQFTNPEYHSLETKDDESKFQNINNDLKINYPTISTVPGANLKKLIDKIPNKMWDELKESLPSVLLRKYQFLNISDSLKVIHGKIKPSDELNNKTEQRLIYEEFFIDQIKIYLRRKYFKKPSASNFEISKENLQKILKYFPYNLTGDQLGSVEEILKDLKSGHPMMRLIQGDVGCGKTWIAFIAALVVMKNEGQVAIMCPTEALALQHFENLKELGIDKKFNISLLLGSDSAKNKKMKREALESGETNLIIGTHSLIQDQVLFKNLQLVVVDEQHKFGVDQRIKLSTKTPNAHCLIMSATPIPRSLSLTRYGDLDISIIKSMPTTRKGYKTRIVNNETFSQYLSFIKTRLSMNEQVYIVVPAIEDNPEQDFHNLETTLASYKKYFPDYRIAQLHGQMKPEEKANTFLNFKSKKIDILIATSVIEVGINVPNATVIAILNPERFGLSSLHQLRGRVGRGEKPGFCFLVNDKEISETSKERLKVIEGNSDGFKIAEEDLRLRGEGDIFGIHQSGGTSGRRFSNIIEHSSILEQARADFFDLIDKNDPELSSYIDKFSNDSRIFHTV